MTILTYPSIKQDDKPKLLHPPPCVYETVNPKAVSGDELYGYMTLAKDWKARDVRCDVCTCSLIKGGWS